MLTVVQKFLHTLVQTLKAFRCCPCLHLHCSPPRFALGTPEVLPDLEVPGTSGRAVICLLKPQRPDVGTTDSQVPHFMSGEYFDILVEHLQCHFMISVEVTVFVPALTDRLKGVYFLGSGSVLSRL